LVYILSNLVENARRSNSGKKQAGRGTIFTIKLEFDTVEPTIKNTVVLVIQTIRGFGEVNLLVVEDNAIKPKWVAKMITKKGLNTNVILRHEMDKKG
jgi:hypothetical protein